MATRSVKCNLKNASGYALALMDSTVIDGIILPPGPPATIADGATGTWLAESDGITSGTQGSVRYRVKDPHGSTFTVTWDNPFIGKNAFQQFRTDDQEPMPATGPVVPGNAIWAGTYHDDDPDDDEDCTITYTCWPIGGAPLPEGESAVSVPSAPVPPEVAPAATPPDGDTHICLSPPAGPGTTLFIYAQFGDPQGRDPWSSEADEVAAMRNGRWRPWTRAFEEMANWDVQQGSIEGRFDGTPEVWNCTNFGEFANAIAHDEHDTARKAGSVGRVYLITHANPGLIGLSGYLDLAKTEPVCLRIRGCRAVCYGFFPEFPSSGEVDRVVSRSKTFYVPCSPAALPGCMHLKPDRFEPRPT
ncbi:MAG: hypothetical protein HY908_36710 [Myxococcales bacterium]|nr:hypothetical protein [Myxococcales bacterium]